MTNKQPPEIFVEGEPRTHHTVTFLGYTPEYGGEAILRIVGEALQAEGVMFQVTALEVLAGDEAMDPRVAFGIRLNGKDL